MSGAGSNSFIFGFETLSCVLELPPAAHVNLSQSLGGCVCVCVKRDKWTDSEGILRGPCQLLGQTPHILYSCVSFAFIHLDLLAVVGSTALFTYDSPRGGKWSFWTLHRLCGRRRLSAAHQGATPFVGRPPDGLFYSCRYV